jgi:hypothetical protein
MEQGFSRFARCERCERAKLQVCVVCVHVVLMHGVVSVSMFVWKWSEYETCEGSKTYVHLPGWMCA